MRILILEPERYPPPAEVILRKLGEVAHLQPSQNIQKAVADAEALVVRLKYLLNRDLLDHAKRLKVIATATTGLDHIDTAAAEERGIAVLSLRGESEFLKTVTATAEHTWGLLLALIRHIPEAHYAVLRGEWDRTRFFGRELQGRTLAVLGMGRIGQMIARYGIAFRMGVIGYDPRPVEWTDGVQRAADLRGLLQAADVVSLHVPLTTQTEKLIGKHELAMIKPRAILINTSRGALLDEAALLHALETGRLAGAALDVLHDEYHQENPERHQLIHYAATHNNLLITPHLGGATHDSLERVEIFMAEKLAKHLTSLNTD